MPMRQRSCLRSVPCAVGPVRCTAVCRVPEIPVRTSLRRAPDRCCTTPRHRCSTRPTARLRGSVPQGVCACVCALPASVCRTRTTSRQRCATASRTGTHLTNRVMSEPDSEHLNAPFPSGMSCITQPDPPSPLLTPLFSTQNLKEPSQPTQPLNPTQPQIPEPLNPEHTQPQNPEP